MNFRRNDNFQPPEVPPERKLSLSLPLSLSIHFQIFLRRCHQPTRAASRKVPPLIFPHLSQRINFVSLPRGNFFYFFLIFFALHPLLNLICFPSPPLRTNKKSIQKYFFRCLFVFLFPSSHDLGGCLLHTFTLHSHSLCTSLTLFLTRSLTNSVTRALTNSSTPARTFPVTHALLGTLPRCLVLSSLLSSSKKKRKLTSRAWKEDDKDFEMSRNWSPTQKREKKKKM